MKIIKHLLIALTVISTSVFALSDDFVHPLTYKDTPEERAELIAYIQSSVKETYTALGMGEASTLRMMEQEELAAFKKLLRVQDIKLLNNVRIQYCSIGMCAYSTFLMMYQEEYAAERQELEW